MIQCEVLPQYVIDQLQLLRLAKETGTVLLHLKDGEIRDADFQPPKRKFRPSEAERLEQCGTLPT